MDHRDLSTCLWALAKLGLGRDTECPKTILKILKSEAFLSGLKTTLFLSQTLWALSRLGVLNTSKSLTKRVVRVLRDVDLTNADMFDCAKLGTIAWVFTSCSEMLLRSKKFARVAKSLSKTARSRVEEMDFKTLGRIDLWSRIFEQSVLRVTSNQWLDNASATKNETELFTMVREHVMSLSQDETFLKCRKVLVVNDESRDVRRVLRASFRKSHQNNTREKSVKMKHWCRFSRASEDSSERGRNKPPKLKKSKKYDVCFMRLPIGTDSLSSQLHVLASVMKVNAKIYIYGRNRRYLTVPHVAISPLFDNARVVRRSELFALVEASLSVENDSKTSLTKDWKQVSDLDINGDSNSWTTYPGLFAAGQLDIMTSWLLSVLSREFFVSSCSKDSMLDFCSGSGVIAHVLKRKVVSSSVSLLDADKLALYAAKQNVKDAENYYLSDGWRDVPDDAKFDAIVSNPPVHRYESSDLSVLKHLIDGAPAHMKPNGRLYIVAQEMLPVGVLLESNGSFSKDSIRPFVDPTNRFVVWVACVRS